MIDSTTRRQIVFWLATGCFLVFLMVVIGGITRLTGSGLSMVDWNYLMGSFPPVSESVWEESFEAYKQFPEYQVQPEGFSIGDYKKIFWWEYIHRMMGRFIGLVFAIPFLYFLISGKIRGALLRKVLVLFSLGALQGFLGWYMVKSGLVNDPHVSHFRLALHLVTAFITFAYGFWLILELIFSEKIQNPNLLIKRFTILMLLVLLVQIIYGAFVAGLKAGLFFNTFPMMGDKWIADGVFAMKPLYMNFLEGIAGVQFIHRYVAILILVIEIVFFFSVMKKDLRPELKSALKLGMAVVLIQETLGIFTLIFSVPLSLGLLHQIGAFVLMAVMIYTLRLSSFSSLPLSNEDS